MEELHYMDMVMQAKKDGKASEEKMWQSIAQVEELLEHVDEPTRQKFLRDQHEMMYGPHYNPTFAEYDLSRIAYTDRDNAHRKGPHWTREQALQAITTRPKAVTECDIYVAANVMYSDLCGVFDDAQIIKATVAFFLEDEDAPEGKIWRYVAAMNH